MLTKAVDAYREGTEPEVDAAAEKLHFRFSPNLMGSRWIKNRHFYILSISSVNIRQQRSRFSNILKRQGQLGSRV
jgi:hypothetical protein